jgi:hypothetical protein
MCLVIFYERDWSFSFELENILEGDFFQVMRCLVLMMAASCSANGMYSSFLFFGGVVSSMVPSLSSLSSSGYAYASESCLREPIASST